MNMSLISLKVLAGQLISNFVTKYNSLVDEVIYNVEIVNNKLRFHKGDGVIELNLPVPTPTDVPENNAYVSNNFILDGDDYNKVISDLDAILGALAPATAETFTDKAVPYNTEMLFYRARLSENLASDWYTTDVSAGMLIDRYSIDNTYTLYTPTNTFRTGSKNAPTGSLLHMLDGSQFVSLAVSIPETTRTFTSSAGTSILKVSSSVYNNIWQKGAGTIVFTQTRAGHIKHKFKSLDGSGNSRGETNGFDVWWDNLNATPSFQGQITQTNPNTEQNLKFLSGVAYYGINSAMTINYVALNLFKNCYHPDNVSIISSPYFANIVVNPPTPPAANSSFVVNQPVILSNQNVSSGSSNGTVTVTLYRPTGSTVTQTGTLARRVCTYDDIATDTDERFYDESRRVLTDLSTRFVSIPSLANTYAQVLNGSLVYGIGDYSTKIGEQEYQRMFVKASASNGVLTFQGITHSQISAYNTGNLNVLLRLDGSNLYFDLGIANGAGGNGATRLTAKGCKRADASTGGSVAFSFGLSSTADTGNLGQYRIIIIFRSTTIGKSMSITRLTIT